MTDLEYTIYDAATFSTLRTMSNKVLRDARMPRNRKWNAVDAVLSNPLLVRNRDNKQLSIHAASVALPGFVFFAWIYRMAQIIHVESLSDSTGSVEKFVSGIPERTWAAFGKLLNANDVRKNMGKVFWIHPHTSYTYYFPVVRALAAKTNIHPDQLYWKPTQHLVDGVVVRDQTSYMELMEKKHESAKAQARATKCNIKNYLKQKYHLFGSRPPTPSQLFCTGRTAAERCGKHLVVAGGSRVCRECGLVVGTVFGVDTDYDDDGNVVAHTTAEAPKKAIQLRYLGTARQEHAARPANDPSRAACAARKSAAEIHRERYVKAMDHFCTRIRNTATFTPHKLPPKFINFLLAIWDTTVEGGFSPSSELSLEITLMGYLLWKTLHEPEHHYLDFCFADMNVKYLALDFQGGGEEVVFFRPAARVPSVAFRPNSSVYFASTEVQVLLMTAAAVHKRSGMGSKFRARLNMYHTPVDYLATITAADRAGVTQMRLRPSPATTTRLDLAVAVTVKYNRTFDTAPARDRVPKLRLSYQGHACVLTHTKYVVVGTTSKICAVFVVPAFRPLVPKPDDPDQSGVAVCVDRCNTVTVTGSHSTKATTLGISMHKSVKARVKHPTTRTRDIIVSARVAEIPVRVANVSHLVNTYTTNWVSPMKASAEKAESVDTAIAAASRFDDDDDEEEEEEEEKEAEKSVLDPAPPAPRESPTRNIFKDMHEKLMAKRTQKNATKPTRPTGPTKRKPSTADTSRTVGGSKDTAQAKRTKTPPPAPTPTPTIADGLNESDGLDESDSDEEEL